VFLTDQTNSGPAFLSLRNPVHLVIKTPTTTSSRHLLLETATHDFNRYPRPLLLRRNYALSTTRHRIRTNRNIEKSQCLTGRVMAAEVEDLEALIGRIPACCSTTTPELRCCCGRTDCAYLKHNVGVWREALSYFRLLHEMLLRQCPLPEQSYSSNC
jgi:hypothetical protein